MLTEVCDFVHNYFEYATIKGTFEISNGRINVDGVHDGQRFRVVGSALNDGIYTYHSSGEIFDDDNENSVQMDSETFDGCIVLMSIPRSFIKIVEEIADWQQKNKDVLESPYMSESFGGYSYTKATRARDGSSNSGVVTWQTVFQSKLNAYRKIA